MRTLIWILSLLAGGHDGLEPTDRLVPAGWKGNPWGPEATLARAEGRIPAIPKTPALTLCRPTCGSGHMRHRPRQPAEHRSTWRAKSVVSPRWHRGRSQRGCSPKRHMGCPTIAVATRKPNPRAHSIAAAQALRLYPIIGPAPCI